MRRLTGVFALHEAQKEEIVRVYGIDPAQVHVVGTGFNASIFNTGVPETCDDGASGRSASASARATDAPMGASTCADVCANVPVELVYAGKIWKKKGVPSLLEAADLVETARREGARRSESPSLRLRLRLAGVTTIQRNMPESLHAPLVASPTWRFSAGFRRRIWRRRIGAQIYSSCLLFSRGCRLW